MRRSVPLAPGRVRAGRPETGIGVRPGSSIARILARVLVLGLALGPGTGSAAPPAPDDIGSLPAVLLEALSSTGLIGRGEPVAAFDWTYETKRPARAPRRVRERFAGTPRGAPAGLSPIVRETLSPKPRPARLGVSVRGLALVQPDDTGLDVRVEGLVLPLDEGARFALAYDEDGSSLSQDCVVGALAPASRVHPAIPGNARSIECSGRGSYHGIPVRVTARVVYFPGLGVFLDIEQLIDSPIGRLRAGTRVLSFEMAKP